MILFINLFKLVVLLDSLLISIINDHINISLFSYAKANGIVGIQFLFVWLAVPVFTLSWGCLHGFVTGPATLH